jgi:prolyl oligopeptidase
LRAVSAYHQVKEGAPYPAALLIAGLHDPQVDPWQAAKMAARLRAANAAGKPVLLRIDPESGPRSEQRIQDLADIYSFLLWQFGDAQFQVAPPADAITPQAANPPQAVTPAQAGAQSPIAPAPADSPPPR